MTAPEYHCVVVSVQRKQSMYLVLNVDSEIDEIWFEWDCQFGVSYLVDHDGTWSLVLYVIDEEWADVEWPAEEDMPEEIYWLGLCNEYELE